VDPSDRSLGMDRTITRRDFLDGVSLAIGGAVLAGSAAKAAGDDYPPGRSGVIRGQYDGSFTTAHSLRDGKFWEKAGAPEDTGEKYDLVVVGGGLSGLAAAYFYRHKAGKNARILILDNLDDFGGHAKRNEFSVAGRTLLSYGGTQSIESPSKYSAVSKRLFSEIGIEPKRFYQYYDQKLYPSMKLTTGIFFSKEVFGESRLVPGMETMPWAQYLAKTPLSEPAKHDLLRLYTEKVDYLAGMTHEQKRKKLASISYADFLVNVAKAHKDVLPFFQNRTHDLWAVGIDAIPALVCFEGGDDYSSGYPGFQGLGLGDGREKEEPYIFHFPDGNASIARMMVRSMIPSAIPGHTMEDIVLARADYTKLDEAASPVRIRLSSTVARVRHNGEPGTAKDVEVSYIRNGKLQSVRASHAVMACFNGMVPYLCPELPEKQREGLKYGVKAPLVYTHVVIRNWKPFQKANVFQVLCPGSYHSYFSLDFPVSMGGYNFAKSPDDPAVLFLLHTPCQPGLSQRDQHRAGRVQLLATKFETFERKIREQLGGALGPTGLDPAGDILGITVNRWAHGYAYSRNSLFDPDWPAGQQPWVVGRKPFGRITIANSDAGADAYTNVAFDQAYRAVGEIALH